MNVHENNSEMLSEFGGIHTNDLRNILQQEDSSTIKENEPQILHATNYIDLNTINRFIEKNKDGFTVFSANIECLKTKFDQLVAVIKYLREVHQFHFSVICLQECWLKEDDVSDLSIPDYSILAQKQQCSTKGGFVTYIYKEFNGVDTNSFKPSPKKLWEAQSITITGNRLEKKLKLINFYRPPHFNNNNETVQTFTNEIGSYIAKSAKEKCHVIYAGDFNINLLHLHEREKYQEYLDRFIAAGLYPRITLPTRFSNKGCTLIDQIFCKFADPLHQYNTEILTTKISDHFPCLLGFEISPKLKERPKYVEKTDMIEKNVEKFCGNIKFATQIITKQVEDEQDVDSCYKILEDTVKVQYLLSFPQKKLDSTSISIKYIHGLIQEY